MVEVEPKLIDLTLMARTAQSQLIRFQQPFASGAVTKIRPINFKPSFLPLSRVPCPVSR